MSSTQRRIAATLLALTGVLIAAMPALARDHSRPSACAHALELADQGMRQLGDAQPVDRGALTAYYTGHHDRMAKLGARYAGMVDDYAATMRAYHLAASRCHG